LMGTAQLSAVGPPAYLGAAVLVAGWLPLLVGARLCGVRLRPGRILMGAGLSAFIGGFCSLELVRHGLLASPESEILLPGTGLAVHALVRYALLGGAGALCADWLLDALGRVRPESSKANLKESTADGDLC
jgi:hypothetical protein